MAKELNASDWLYHHTSFLFYEGVTIAAVIISGQQLNMNATAKTFLFITL